MATKKTLYNDIIIEKGQATNLETLNVPNIISEVPLMKGFEHAKNIIGKAKVYRDYLDGKPVLKANLVMVIDHHIDGYPCITLRRCKGKTAYDELQCVIISVTPNKDTTIKAIYEQIQETLQQ